MKKLMVIILMMAEIAVVAQEQDVKVKREAMKDLTPEQLATLQTKKMTLALDLNESQRTKMISMFTEDAKSRKVKKQAFKKRKEEGVTMSSDEKFTIQHERLDHKIARKNEKKTILTEDQYAKWEKMNHRRRIHSKGKREGHSRGMQPKRN